MAENKEKDLGGEPEQEHQEDEVKLELLEKLHGYEEKTSQLEGSLNNVVEEMKVLRKKKEPEAEPKKDEDLSEKIKEVLLEDKKKESVNNLEKAKIKFKNDFKAFHSDNDKGGLKIKVVEDAFKRLDTTNHFSVDELYEDLVFAYKGIKEDSEPIEKMTPYASSPKEGGVPKTVEPKEAKLSEQDVAWSKALGIDPEKLKERLTKRKVG
jgi:hypothetical protein